ncbi:MAG: cold shock domain-containing protein [Ferruginibacter sp.]
MVRTGTVSFFNMAKGFGFINDQKNGMKVFVHVNDLTEMVQEGNKVKFELQDGPRGPVAVNVTLIE